MKRALVTGGTRDDVAPIAVFIMNIRDTNSHLFDEIVVYHDGIKKKDQDIINSIYKTRFIEYDYKPKTRNDEVISYFSRMVYCKYECFALLDDYDEVVWSDYDVVVLDKLDEFCRIENDEFNVLTCDTGIKSMLYKDIINTEIMKYNLEIDGISTPLFALSKRLPRYGEIHKWCYDKTNAWGEDLYLPEQCIFGFAVQEFDIPIKRFKLKDYACFPPEATGEEKILHAAGPVKFWNGMNNEIWNKNYEEWLKLGGTRYSDFRKKMKRKYLFVITRLAGIRYKEHG